MLLFVCVMFSAMSFGQKADDFVKTSVDQFVARISESDGIIFKKYVDDDGSYTVDLKFSSYYNDELSIKVVNTYAPLDYLKYSAWELKTSSLDGSTYYHAGYAKNVDGDKNKYVDITVLVSGNIAVFSGRYLTLSDK